MKNFKLISVIILSLTLTYCSIDDSTKKISNEVFRDTTFFQEYHIGYTIGVSERENDVRSIAVDSLQNIWIATRNGVFVKLNNSEKWKTVQNTQDRGPSFSVEADDENNVWFGTVFINTKIIILRKLKKLYHQFQQSVQQRMGFMLLGIMVFG